MKTSVTTGEVSLRWAKKADQRAKSSENGPISPNCYLLGLRRRLDYGPRQQKYHENVGNNHLKTLNIRSNGKSRAEASLIKVGLGRIGETVQLFIEDNGKGLAPSVKPAKGLGLRIMAYRTVIIGGELNFKSPSGGGTRITCVVPFEIIIKKSNLAG